MVRLAALFLLAAAAAVAPGQDWPSWRGAARDGKLRGFEAPATWPEALERGWRVEVGTGHSTPALVGGRLYVLVRQGEDEVILALEARTGRERWRRHYPAPYEMDPTATSHGKGPRSSVAVSDGRVFTLGITGVLSCFDADTGEVLWRKDFRDRFPKTSPRYGAAMSPLVHDGLVIAHVGGPGRGAMVALDVASGEERWSWDGDGPAYASPIVATVGGRRQLITQTEFHAVSLSPADGKLLWKLELKTLYEQNAVTPVMVEDLVILSGYHLGTRAYRIDGEAPVEAWRTRRVSLYMSTPIARGRHLFGFSEKRRGQLFCLDAETGEVLWTGDGRQGENAALVDAGSAILALNTKAELIVFQPTADSYTELRRYTVAETPTWAHPVVSGRSIYIKDEKTLTRWVFPGS